VDGKTHVVEDQLPSFFRGVYSVAQDEKEQREKREEAKRRRIQAERQRQEEERRRKEEEARRQDLLRQSQWYKEARDLRVYIAAVLERAKGDDLSSEEERALNEWKEWAHAQADQLDPLVGPPSVSPNPGSAKG
jgi:ATPase subunit of ABC transporter with duplicated ATPase domains